MRVPAKGVGRPGRDLRQLKRVSVRRWALPPLAASTGHPLLCPRALTRLLWLAPKAPHQGWGPAQAEAVGAVGDRGLKATTSGIEGAAGGTRGGGQRREGREGRKMQNLGWLEADQVCGVCRGRVGVGRGQCGAG